MFVHVNGPVTMDFVAFNIRIRLKDRLNTDVWQECLAHSHAALDNHTF